MGRGSRVGLQTPVLRPPLLRPGPGETPEHRKLSRAHDQCREILRFVNEAVKRAENQHRLEAYQKRLDATALERTGNPLAAEFKVGPRPAPPRPALRCAPPPQHSTFCLSAQSLDLRSRRMIREGPLSWRISKDKTVGA